MHHYDSIRAKTHVKPHFQTGKSERANQKPDMATTLSLLPIDINIKVRGFLKEKYPTRKIFKTEGVKMYFPT